MSIDFCSDKNVTIKQLIDAGARCGIVVTKNTLRENTYTMTWDVDDYENYATNVLTNPETQKAFRERIEPRGDRFVMKRNFHLRGDNFSYSCSTHSDDLGIAHRLIKEVNGVELISLDEHHERLMAEEVSIDKSMVEFGCNVKRPTYTILDNGLPYATVILTASLIGCSYTLVTNEDECYEDTFLIFGNDEYGYAEIRTDEEQRFVTGISKFGQGEKNPIRMMAHCFNFMAYETEPEPDICYEHDHDLEKLPHREFFAKHYPNEFKMIVAEEERVKEFAENHSDLNSYIESERRSMNSYRYEYAHANNLPLSEVTDVSTVIDFIYEKVKNKDEMDHMLKQIRERQHELKEASHE